MVAPIDAAYQFYKNTQERMLRDRLGDELYEWLERLCLERNCERGTDES